MRGFRAAVVVVVVATVAALFAVVLSAVPVQAIGRPLTVRAHLYDVAANDASARSIAASRPPASQTADDDRRASVRSAEPSSIALVVAAETGAVGFADDAVSSAYQGMRSGGGHAMRHLIDEGLIPNSGNLASRASLFEDLTSPILRNPSSSFNWQLGDTATRAFAGEAGGSQVVVFVAKEGPYAGRVISAVVPDANQVAQWGL